MDVVIVTLLRSSLRYTLKSVYETIPDPHVILVTGKGVIGDLRNKGLMQCSSRLVCFVDDDVILNREWYDKCMKRLMQNDGVIGVAGRLRDSSTCGCMILKTKEFKEAGGWPRWDALIGKKLGKQLIQIDAICDNMDSPLQGIQHQFHWLTHGFQTESKVGFNRDPRLSLRLMLHFIRIKKPEGFIVQLFWIVKALFTWPYLVWWKNE